MHVSVCIVAYKDLRLNTRVARQADDRHLRALPPEALEERLVQRHGREARGGGNAPRLAGDLAAVFLAPADARHT